MDPKHNRRWLVRAVAVFLMLFVSVDPGRIPAFSCRCRTGELAASPALESCRRLHCRPRDAHGSFAATDGDAGRDAGHGYARGRSGVRDAGHAGAAGDAGADGHGAQSGWRRSFHRHPDQNSGSDSHAPANRHANSQASADRNRHAGTHQDQETQDGDPCFRPKPRRRASTCCHGQRRRCRSLGMRGRYRCPQTGHL